MRFDEAGARKDEHRGGIGDAPWGGSPRERDLGRRIGDHEGSEIRIFLLRLESGSQHLCDDGDGRECESASSNGR